MDSIKLNDIDKMVEKTIIDEIKRNCPSAQNASVSRTITPTGTILGVRYNNFFHERMYVSVQVTNECLDNSNIELINDILQGLYNEINSSTKTQKDEIYV